MISKEEVQHITKLARLELNQKEIVKMQKDLADILGYIELLNEVDVSQTEAFAQTVSSENVIRQDKCACQSEETIKAIMQQFPQKKGNLAKVKEIKWN